MAGAWRGGGGIQAGEPFGAKSLPARLHAAAQGFGQRDSGFVRLPAHTSQGGGRQWGALGAANGQPVGPKLGVDAIRAGRGRGARATLFWVL